MFRPGKLLLILLVPVVLYGVAKGVMYYNTKRAVDDLAESLAGQADLRYQGISTDIRGAVAVEGIEIQPLGSDYVFGIERVRLASDDPMMFLRGANWRPDRGEGEPPDSLSFQVDGIAVPLNDELLAAAAASADPAAGAGRCESSLPTDPAMLAELGFEQMHIDMSGSYRLNRTARELEIGFHADVRDVQSVRLDATLTDVDVAAISQGAPPSLNLGRFSTAVNISPDFGRRALKACAKDTELSLEEWGERLAGQSLQGLEQVGISLGSGLQRLIRDFYTEFGEIEVVAAPSEPVGMLSFLTVPPERLVDTLGMRVSLNGKPVTDTGFVWSRPQASLFGGPQGGDQQGTGPTTPRPARTIVRREYEDVAVGNIGRFVDHEVRVTPRGLPMREGVLKRVADGVAEVEQTVHGGKYTVYVPLRDIESLQALVRRKVSP